MRSDIPANLPSAVDETALSAQMRADEKQMIKKAGKQTAKGFLDSSPAHPQGDRFSMPLCFPHPDSNMDPVYFQHVVKRQEESRFAAVCAALYTAVMVPLLSCAFLVENESVRSIAQGFSGFAIGPSCFVVIAALGFGGSRAEELVRDRNTGNSYRLNSTEPVEQSPGTVTVNATKLGRHLTQLFVNYYDHALPSGPERSECYVRVYDIAEKLATFAEAGTEQNLKDWCIAYPEETREMLDGIPARLRKEQAYLLACDILNKLNPAAPDNKTFEAVRTAEATHQEINHEWENIITDPLNALELSSLFDVTSPHTAAFVTAHEQAGNYQAVHGHNIHSNPDTAATYLNHVSALDRTWQQAKTYAERTRYDWLPPAEANTARRAAALLATAADPAATLQEQRTAANKAAQLLNSIRSFTLPAAAHTQLEQAATPQIEPA